MKRPVLHEISLSEVFPLQGPELIMTMSNSQWDKLLEMSYEHGWILLELDNDEQPVKAYRKQERIQ